MSSNQSGGPVALDLVPQTISAETHENGGNISEITVRRTKNTTSMRLPSQEPASRGRLQKRQVTQMQPEPGTLVLARQGTLALFVAEETYRRSCTATRTAGPHLSVSSTIAPRSVQSTPR